MNHEVPDYSKWVQYGNRRPSRWIKDSHHKTLEESEENDAVDPKKLQYLEIQKNWSGSTWELSAVVHHTR